jgi:hypothetical protein
VLLGRELLVAEEDDTVLGKGALHLAPLAVGERSNVYA